MLFEAPTVEGLARHVGSAAQGGRAALRARARPSEIPLSYAQRRLWFLDRLEGGSEGHRSATYTIPLAVRLGGELDCAALEAALCDVVDRHESLRTIFPERLGVPRQQILEGVAGRVRLVFEEVSEAGLAAALSAAGRRRLKRSARSLTARRLPRRALGATKSADGQESWSPQAHRSRSWGSSTVRSRES